MEDVIFDRYQVPAFGNWNYSDHEFPITQCFESLVHAGTVGGHAFGDDGGLFRVAIPATYHHQRKIKKGSREGSGGGEKPQQHQPYGKEQQRRQGRVCDAAVEAASNRRAPRRQRSPKAVDEDLYKIPSDLIYQKTKRKRVPRGMWLGCLGLNCIAA